MVFLGGKLGQAKGVQVVVQPLMCHQFTVCPSFNQPAFVENEDAVRPLYRREAMGDDKCGPPLHQLLECLLNKPFGFAVQR